MDNFNRIVKRYHGDDGQPVRSYKVGRNELCPCGSGKKYKKCCERVQPERSREDYYQEIEAEKDGERVFELLQEAVEDYPLDHSFILPLAVYYLQQGNIEEARDYIHRAWRLMGTDLEDDFLLALVNLLLDQGELGEAAEIASTAREEKEETAPVLLAWGEVVKARGNYREALELADRARELAPRDLRVLGFKMETYLEMNDIPAAMDIFLENFDSLKHLDSVYSVRFLRNLLQKQFGLSHGPGEDEFREKLNLARDVLKKWQELDRLMERAEMPEADSQLRGIEEMLPPELGININLLTYHLDLGNYQYIQERGEKLSEYHEGHPQFNWILFQALTATGRREEAVQYGEKAFDLLSDEEKPERPEVIFGLVRHYLEMEAEDKLLQLLREVDKVSGDRRTASLLFAGSTPQDTNYFQQLFEILKREDLAGLSLSRREVLLYYIFILLIEIERLSLHREDLTYMEAELEELLAEADGEEIESPLLRYARLQLTADDLSAEEITSRVEGILATETEMPEEVDVKYEALLEFGDPRRVLDESPQKKDLKEGAYEYYAALAAVKLRDREEIFRYLPGVLQRHQNAVTFLLRLTRYLELEEIGNLLKSLGVREEYVSEYLNTLKRIIEE
ncbi:MAG: SEC-C metal-binding domain-containing protein [Bacillota bacterium]